VAAKLRLPNRFTIVIFFANNHQFCFGGGCYRDYSGNEPSEKPNQRKFTG
jgi:hypothetical protein